MKKRKLLTPEEEGLMSEFYISPHYQVLKKLLNNQLRNIEKLAISSESMDTLKDYRGVYVANKAILSNIKRIHTNFNERKKDATKKS